MAIVTDGLVLYLHGACGKNNPATRVWKDLSGNGNDGQLVNFGYIEGSGWVDGGLKFDGVDDYVQLPDLALNPDNFTIQVDDKIRVFNGDKVITENGDEWGRNLIKKGDELYNWQGKQVVTSTTGAWLWWRDVPRQAIYQIEAKTDDELLLGIEFGWQWSSRLQGDTIILSNEWQRVVSPYFDELGAIGLRCMSGAGGVIQLRRIKAEYGSQATPWTPAPEDITETNIINHNTPFVENNTIHTLRFYNRALTDEEIMQNYQAGHEWTPVKGKREVITTMKPIITSLSRKGKGKRELISTMKPITISLERKGKGKREVISIMKPTTSSLSRRGVGRREVTTTIRPITSSISKKLPPIHADMDIRERTPNITTRERIPKLEVD